MFILKSLTILWAINKCGQTVCGTGRRVGLSLVRSVTKASFIILSHATRH